MGVRSNGWPMALNCPRIQLPAENRVLQPRPSSPIHPKRRTPVVQNLSPGEHMAKMRLALLDGSFSIHRLNPQQPVPPDLFECPFFSISRTPEELSIVAPESAEIKSDQVEPDWRGIKLIGPLHFGLVGVLADITAALAKAGISIFAVSTYDTDYVFIKSFDVDKALRTLEDSGYAIEPNSGLKGLD